MRIEWKVEPASRSEIEEVSVEVKIALQVKRGKAVGPDDIPAEV